MKMAHLNQFRKLKQLSAFLVGNFLFITSTQAGVLQFVDTTDNLTDKTFKTDFKLFMANDPVSIDEILHDFGGEYTPESGANIALLDSRFDIGFVHDSYYLGYFYQYNLFIDTNKDFTDLFYAVKNKNDLDSDKSYALDLDILGIRQSGLLFSKSTKLYEDDEYVFSLGSGGYVAYGSDMQDGYMTGTAGARSEKDYDLDVDSSYYFTQNYLYDLKVKSVHGVGYGFHVGMSVEDKKHQIKLRFLANDLVSKMHWKDLPYSKISLKTSNKSYDENGYVKYAPTISGLEKYVDYTQTLEAKYNLQASAKLKNIELFVGVDLAYGSFFPYIKANKKLNNTDTIEAMYESRFGSFGVGYRYKNFKLSIMADDFSNNSSFGVNSSLSFKF
jgi:hypothetical protein